MTRVSRLGQNFPLVLPSRRLLFIPTHSIAKPRTPSAGAAVPGHRPSLRWAPSLRGCCAAEKSPGARAVRWQKTDFPQA